MKTSSPSLLIAGVCLAFGAASGYWAGSNRSENEASTQENKDVKATLSSRVAALTQEERGGNSVTSRQLEQILSRPGQLDRFQGLMERYDSLTASEFEAESEKIRNFSGAERMIASFLLYSKWGEKDPIAAMDHANTLGFGAMMVKPVVLQGWAAKDPAAAAKYFQENPQDFPNWGGGRGRGFAGSTSSTIASEWARQNPEEAMKWAKTLNGRDQADAAIGVIQSLSSTDPAKAAKMATDLEGNEKLRALQEVAGNWASSDWGATEAWISSLPADEQSAVKASAIESLSRTNPEEAAQKVLAMSDGEEKMNAMQEVAQNMARKDPAAGVEFLMKNATPEVQAEGIDDTMQIWARKDPAAAGAWISKMGQGAVRDNAVASYSMSAAKQDPQQRLELVESIGNEQLRERTTTRVAAQWMRTDKEAAQQWMNGANLSEESKRRIIGVSEGRRRR